MPFRRQSDELLSLDPLNDHRPEWNWFWRNVAFVVQTTSLNAREIIIGTELTTSGTPTALINSTGQAVSLDAAGSDFLEIPDAAGYDILGPITLIWFGIVDAATNYTQLINKHSGSGNTNAPYAWRGGAGATDSDFSFIRGGPTPGKWQGWNSTSSISVPTSAATLLGVSNDGNIDSGSEATFYVDGVGETQPSTRGTPGEAITGNAEGIRIGRRADDATQLEGQVFYVAGFHEFWNAAQHALLAKDPYGPFRESDVLTVLATIAAGGTIIPQIQSYRRQRSGAMN